jgi:putative Ca2+/H+ antiporter (TMEM165/GDT1 family)
MVGLVPFAGALGLIIVLELGDKTQLATISLASRNPWPAVFFGAANGLVFMTAIGTAVGVLLAEISGE